MESEMLMIKEKNEAIEAEFKNIKDENKNMKSKFDSLEKEIEYLKTQIKRKEHADEKVVEHEVEAADPESKSCISCGKCDFVAKSEAGLKTHDTVKHKSIFRAYSKVSR